MNVTEYASIDDLEPLWAPVSLGRLSLPNRLMASATTLQYGENQQVSPRHLAYYRERARGGVGLMFSEELSATPICVSPFPSALDAHDPDKSHGLRAIVEELAPYPTRFYAQLFASGAYTSSTPGMEQWEPARAPSRVGVPGFETPLPLTVDEIEQIVADFALSAKNVAAAGVHGVEVHGAHGWLIGQFLSPYFNRRDDGYGGSLERRCRIAVEIGRAIRAEVGDLPIGLALSFDEYIGPVGITEAETLAQLELLVRESEFDFYDLSAGSPHSEEMQIAPMGVPEGFGLGFAARAKKVVGDRAAIFVAGRVVDVGMAAAAVASGAADVVAMTRAHIADPHIVRKAQTGKRDEITPCVGANVCLARAVSAEPVACVVTPASGRELQWTHDLLDPSMRTPTSRKVAIVGAGPAGLQAAAVASERGHRVVVLERASAPGGHLRQLSTLPFRESWQRSIDSLVRRIERAGGEIRCGETDDLGALESIAPDELIVAVGAAWDATGDSTMNPSRGRIPGAIPDQLLVGLGDAIEQVTTDASALGRRVLVLDTTGQAAVFGLVEKLARAGVEVELVTPLDAAGGSLSVRLELPHVLARLSPLNVKISVQEDIESIDDHDVRIASVWGSRHRTLHDVDRVVISQDRVPQDDVIAALRRVYPAAHVIGDARSPRSTEAVIHEAEELARRL